MAELNLKSGGHLRYEDSGRGRPLVFLHGWGMRGGYFEKQLAALSSRYRVIVPDLRGHGHSDPLVDGQGLTTLVDDVTELLISLDLTQTILVGWSMGAMLAWGVMQREAASRVSGLVTIDMVPRLLNDESWRFGLREGRDASVFSKAVDRMRTNWPGFTRIFVPRIFAAGRAAERKQMIDQMVNVVEQNHPESMAHLWMSMASQDFRPGLAAIDVPTLVIYGQRSQLYREEASAWLAAELPNARRVGFADSGHAPHLEEPDFFNREIGKFADDIGDRIGGESQDITSESN